MFKSQKILPLVYDDSISYYEQVCKLTQKVNELVEFMNNQSMDIIQSYINEQFDNLMINAIYDPSTETIALEKGTKKDE